VEFSHAFGSIILNDRKCCGIIYDALMKSIGMRTVKREHNKFRAAEPFLEGMAYIVPKLAKK
jgi:hypothetical protein